MATSPFWVSNPAAGRLADRLSREVAAVLEASGLTRRFSGISAVNNVSFTVSPGEILGYLGPNGSGKTTTVRMITGLLEPSSGRVYFEGHNIADDLVGFRRRLGYVPEEPYLYPFLSGREYLQLVGRLRELPTALLDRKIDSLLRAFGLEGDGEQAIGSYSKGMKQKVLIIAALLHDPDVLVFDEPLSGLDPTAALVFRYLVKELASRAKIILYSSHVLEVVEKLCSRVVVLHRGRVVAHDSVQHLREALSRDSLEDVFTDLVMQDNPERLAREIAEIAAMRV
jgi:ABC-2 type transport system ATP-binding protein